MLSSGYYCELCLSSSLEYTTLHMQSALIGNRGYFVLKVLCVIFCYFYPVIFIPILGLHVVTRVQFVEFQYDRINGPFYVMAVAYSAIVNVVMWIRLSI